MVVLQKSKMPAMDYAIIVAVQFFRDDKLDWKQNS